MLFVDEVDSYQILSPTFRIVRVKILSVLCGISLKQSSLDAYRVRRTS